LLKWLKIINVYVVIKYLCTDIRFSLLQIGSRFCVVFIVWRVVGQQPHIRNSSLTSKNLKI